MNCITCLCKFGYCRKISHNKKVEILKNAIKHNDLLTVMFYNSLINNGVLVDLTKLEDNEVGNYIKAINTERFSTANLLNIANIEDDKFKNYE